MTGGDLLVLAPWVLFGAGLTVVALRLGRPRRPGRRHPARGGGPGPPDELARTAGPARRGAAR
jgi:hypothetical protein